MKTLALFGLLMVMAVQPAGSQETPAEHHAGVVARGEHTMGFSQEKTTHHFLLYKDGGAITVTANDPKDTQDRDMIRMHLSHIAKMFADGNFNAPMLIHGTTLPGVPVMKEVKDQIKYTYQEKDAGGQVRIQSANPKAIEAIHAFLRFQVKEHETGDSGVIEETKP